MFASGDGWGVRMQFINTVTDFEKQYFDRLTVTIDRAGLVERNIIAMDLPDDAVAQISGAPTGSTVKLEHRPHWPRRVPGVERIPPGLYFKVWSQYSATYNEVGIYPLEKIVGSPQQFGVYIKWIDFLPAAPTPRGMAARMLAIIVRQALQIPNVVEMKLWAAGGREWPDKHPGERWGGYYAWPKYGFDMPLADSDREIAKHFTYYPCERDNLLNPIKLLSNCSSVLDVFYFDGGSDYWKVAGSGDYMTFDLSATSRSIEMLNEVLRKAGK